MKKATITLFLVIVAPIAIWIGCEVHHARSSSPEGIEDYLSYLEKMPEPRAVKIMKKEGEEFFVFFGPVTPLALPSGPPAYVFNKEGKMIDWSRDIGEDPSFTKSWKDLPEEEMPIDQADLILKTKIKSNQAREATP